MESLSRSLNAKSMFEPLLPHISGYERYFEQRYDLSDRVKLGGLMPYCSHSLSQFPELKEHLRRALTGALPGHFVRMARSSIRQKRGVASDWRFKRLFHRLQDSVRRRVVVKFVRAQLILPVLISEFAPIVIHVRRDPRSVVASYTRQNWTDWLRSSSLEDLLLTPDDGRRNLFSKWAPQIQRCDELGYLSRVAGYWCLTERFIDQLEANFILARYEELCTGLDEYLNQLLPKDSEVSVKREHFFGESHTSNRVSDQRLESRIFGWKEELSKSDIKEVEGTVRLFGMDEYLVEYNDNLQ